MVKLEKDATYEIYRGKKTSKDWLVPYKVQWFWRLKATNGEIIASHEGYTRKEDCLEAVERVRRAAVFAKVKVLREGK